MACTPYVRICDLTILRLEQILLEFITDWPQMISKGEIDMITGLSLADYPCCDPI